MIKIQGTSDLERVAARLTAAGNVELRKQMFRNIRVAVEPVKPLIRHEALSTLPHSGGANELVANAPLPITATMNPRTATVAIRMVSGGRSRAYKKAQAALGRSAAQRGETSTGWIVRDLRSVNNGRLRHPLPNNNRSEWFNTDVKPGFFTRPCQQMAPAVRAACVVTMEEVSIAAGFR